MSFGQTENVVRTNAILMIRIKRWKNSRRCCMPIFRHFGAFQALLLYDLLLLNLIFPQSISRTWHSCYTMKFEWSNLHILKSLIKSTWTKCKVNYHFYSRHGICGAVYMFAPVSPHSQDTFILSRHMQASCIELTLFVLSWVRMIANVSSVFGSMCHRLLMEMSEKRWFHTFIASEKCFDLTCIIHYLN